VIWTRSSICCHGDGGSNVMSHDLKVRVMLQLGWITCDVAVRSNDLILLLILFISC
jgi:hypothetical protein